MNVDDLIRSRRTRKILAADPTCGTDTWPHPLDNDQQSRTFMEDVMAVVALAGWAPFHHRRDEQNVSQTDVIPEPWRFYVLDRRHCLQLQADLDSILGAEDRRGKIPRLLAGAGALVLACWIPDCIQSLLPTDDATTRAAKEKDNRRLEKRNEEHLAATAAAIQNLLLAAEARNMQTYWSTGGLLRDDRVERHLGIPDNQRLLGALFLAPAADQFDSRTTIATGAHKDSRTDVSQWCRVVQW